MGSMSPRRPFSLLFPHHVERETHEEHQAREAQARAEKPIVERHNIDLHRAMRRVRRATRDLEEAFVDRPLAILALAAGGSFVLGLTIGSRLVRAAAVFGIGAAFATTKIASRIKR